LDNRTGWIATPVIIARQHLPDFFYDSITEWHWLAKATVAAPLKKLACYFGYKECRALACSNKE
jgi:hypothetical protein